MNAEVGGDDSRIQAGEVAVERKVVEELPKRMLKWRLYSFDEKVKRVGERTQMWSPREFDALWPTSSQRTFCSAVARWSSPPGRR